MTDAISDKGYRMPAEWEPHSAIWLAWPYDEKSFPERVGKVENAITKIISAIHLSEQVELLVLDNAMRQKAEQKLCGLDVEINKITFRTVEYIDGWMRDCGPMFVKDKFGRPAMVKWIFNVWGGKFTDLLPDDKLPYRMKDWLKINMEEPQLVLEGGAIDLNGQGLCLTTEQCVLNENRNLGKTKKDVERYLDKYLGVKKTVWLFEGLINDHTDGHIDNWPASSVPIKSYAHTKIILKTKTTPF